MSEERIAGAAFARVCRAHKLQFSECAKTRKLIVRQADPGGVWEYVSDDFIDDLVTEVKKTIRHFPVDADFIFECIMRFNLKKAAPPSRTRMSL